MKRLSTLIMCLLLVASSFAQKNTHYFYFNVGAGASNLSYKLDRADLSWYGKWDGKAGLTANVGYSYMFSSHWGLTTGAGLQSCNTSSFLNNYESKSTQIDSDGDEREFTALFKNWTEKQYALFLDIPLAVQFRISPKKKVGLLASIGTKISIPLKSEYNVDNGQIQASAYFEEWNITFDDLHDQGYGTFDMNESNKLGLKTSVSATADFGGLFKLSPKTELYLGAYVNYGLGNIVKKDGKVIYEATRIYNGVIGSPLTGDVNPISLGVKAGIYFRVAKSKKNKNSPDLSPKPDAGPPVFVKDEFEQSSEVKTQPVLSEPTIPEPVVERKIEVKPAIEVKPVETQPQIASVKKNAKSKNDNKKIKKEAEPVLEKTPVLVKGVVPEEDEAYIPFVASDVQDVENMVIVNDGKAHDSIYAKIAPEKLEVITEAQRRAASLQLRCGDAYGKPVKVDNNTLVELGEIMKKNPKLVLRIIGHTCTLGSYQLNLRVGMSRAMAVQNGFLELGVAPSQLIVESRAYKEPLVPNNTKANRLKNRRVTFEILNKSER